MDFVDVMDPVDTLESVLGLIALVSLLSAYHRHLQLLLNQLPFLPRGVSPIYARLLPFA